MFFMNILFIVFYQPIANLLFFLMDVVRTDSIVVGVLLLVVVVKLILLPSSIKNSKIQQKLSEISGDLKDIKENIKDKKQQMEKTLEVYKRVGVNPFSPIVFLLLQIPFFISIFFVTKDLGTMGNDFFATKNVLYDFVAQPAHIDFTLSFGSFFLDTMQSGAIIIAVLIGVSQFVLMHQTQKKAVTTQKNMKALVYVLPIFIAFLSLSIAATIGVYWLFNNLISILQEVFINRFSNGGDVAPSLTPTDQGGTL
ncbi:MAG: YidC/Oxa1 family membrane protein insertase [Candidatus Kaiserbacteria bacterium]|nr:YidC/Oxa1 family membrane protein insertase [Candidatus Kaiserbacteria bacterium]